MSTQPEPRELLSAVPVALLVIGNGGEIAWSNEAAAALLEGGRGTLGELLAADDAQVLNAAALAGQRGGLLVQIVQAGAPRAYLAVLRPMSSGTLLALLSADGTATVTGLPGRDAFIHRLGRDLRRGKIDERHRFAVLVIDIAGFQLVNDSLGRDSGDALLREVADRLMRSVRPGDEVAHVAGDEFAVLLDRIDSVDTGLAVARRIQEAFAEPFALDGQEVFARVGAGMTFSGGYERAEDMLRDAMIALGRGKAHGPGRLEIFDEEMRARAQVRLRLESEMRRGVDRGEFVLFYQPIVALATGAPQGFEALLRWRHPERGLIGPRDFIRVAEESGLIVPIVESVFTAACVQIREWRQRLAPVSLSMNFTVVHFEQSSVLDTVAAALQGSGLPPEALMVEITETVLVRDFGPVSAALAELRAQRVRVHLDDFGTGYSSLSYLHHLPLDALKIDRSFVARLGVSRSADVLVKTILDLAANLGKDSIGEGIETQAQAQRLRELGCGFGQGYLFARPMPAAEAEEWLQARSLDGADRHPL